MRTWTPLCAVVCLLVSVCIVSAQEVELLGDFEEEAALADWQFVSGTPELVTEGVTHGRKALQVTFDPGAEYHGAYLYWNKVPGDWSDYDALVIDVLNPNQRPIPAYTLIADQAWEGSGRSYWNRHNSQISFAPGPGRWVIPVNGLFRGEAGSRNNDIKRNIDPDSIVRLDVGFGGKGAEGRVIIDNIRFVRTARPAGVFAFDFGPPNQSVMLGWTAVSHETVYSAEAGYGWGPAGGAPWNGADRDTTFGTLLLQDFCEAGGYNFQVDCEPGRYDVTVIYENSGYWGGEQAQHTERRIVVNGEEAWKESRPDGAAHVLYRFEDVEPVGVDVWDTYMADELARPATFTAEATTEGLSLRFEADRTWGSKVAAIAICGAEDQEGSDWLAAQMETVADDFRARAVCLDPPAPEFTPSADWQARGLVAWPVDIEQDIGPNSVPAETVTAEALSIRRLAARGEYEPFCLALRPLKDLGECRLVLEPFSGPGELAAEVASVWYNTSRGFGSIAYHIRPHTLRPAETQALPEGITRQIVVTVRVPEDATPGSYEGALAVVSPEGDTLVRVPLLLRVSTATLSRDTDYLMGFFGLMPPGMLSEQEQSRALEQTLVLLGEHGMNAVSGGPSWTLKGWRDGQPEIDFGAMDGFFSLLREHGFDRPINGYGGQRFIGLHDRYVKGAAGQKVEQDSGLEYQEALLRAWGAVDAHARAENWPLIYYAMCDETRVRAQAEEELAFMQMMAEVSAAYPETVRTSGAYSVHFNQRPEDLDDLLHWHQRFFEALDVSSLNNHDESVMAEAEKLGKEIHIYNQGTSRYSFGLYQWIEFMRGVRARWQWHLNILHGYQFFDLDGREPDTAMLCYGKGGLYPTLQFERCREGAEDFYLYQTLHDVATAGARQGADVSAATKLRDAMAPWDRLNQRRAPEGYDAEEFKAQVIAALEGLQ